jgi:hypothetical protein
MEIGSTVSVYTIEPVVSPVPREREQAAAQPQPEPSTPEQAWTTRAPVENH